MGFALGRQEVSTRSKKVYTREKSNVYKAEELLQSEKFTPSDVAPRGKAIDKVHTPGGCTIKGLFAMEQKALPTLSLRA